MAARAEELDERLYSVEHRAGALQGRLELLSVSCEEAQSTWLRREIAINRRADDLCKRLCACEEALQDLRRGLNGVFVDQRLDSIQGRLDSLAKVVLQQSERTTQRNQVNCLVKDDHWLKILQQPAGVSSLHIQPSTDVLLPCAKGVAENEDTVNLWSSGLPQKLELIAEKLEIIDEIVERVSALEEHWESRKRPFRASKAGLSDSGVLSSAVDEMPIDINCQGEGATYTQCSAQRLEHVEADIDKIRHLIEEALVKVKDMESAMILLMEGVPIKCVIISELQRVEERVEYLSRTVSSGGKQTISEMSRGDQRLQLEEIDTSHVVQEEITMASNSLTTTTLDTHPSCGIHSRDAMPRSELSVRIAQAFGRLQTAEDCICKLQSDIQQRHELSGPGDVRAKAGLLEAQKQASKLMSEVRNADRGMAVLQEYVSEAPASLFQVHELRRHAAQLVQSKLLAKQLHKWTQRLKSICSAATDSFAEDAIVERVRAMETSLVHLRSDLRDYSEEAMTALQAAVEQISLEPASSQQNDRVIEVLENLKLD